MVRKTLEGMALDTLQSRTDHTTDWDLNQAGHPGHTHTHNGKQLGNDTNGMINTADWNGKLRHTQRSKKR